MLQFALSDIEGFKVLQANNRLWKAIPLDYGQWKERVLIIVPVCVNLTKCKAMEHIVA